MKILYCSQGYSPHDYRFLSSLAQTELEIHWLKLERDLILENRRLPESVRSVNWPGDERQHSWLDYWWLKNQFQLVIDRIQPDLVHAGPVQKVAFLPALSGFHPLISMSWGTDLLMDADRDFIWKAITRFTLQHSDWMIGDCLAVQTKATGFGFPKERTTIFPWGIDLKLFHPSESEELRTQLGWKDKFVILCTRNWEPRYGVELVVRTFCQVAARMPDALLVLVGGGSQAEELRRMVNDSGLADRVIFAGRIDYADLPRFYQSADLYVSASHSDGSSVSLMEALGCGCPVLVSDIIANQEWVMLGNQGWLFKDGYGQMLIEQLLNIYEKKNDLAQIRQHARQTALQKADWGKNFQALLTTYQVVTRGAKKKN